MVKILNNNTGNNPRKMVEMIQIAFVETFKSFIQRPNIIAKMIFVNRINSYIEVDKNVEYFITIP
jgi:hypothetical protein